MDIAIELAKCKEAAVKLCDSIGITPESVFCSQVATALLEARADAVKATGDQWISVYGTQWSWSGPVEASELLMREVTARRLRGL